MSSGTQGREREEAVKMVHSAQMGVYWCWEAGSDAG